MILLNALGGVHPRLILIAYAGIASTAFFVMSVGIWASTAATDARRASGIMILTLFAWLFIPFVLGMTPLLTRLGLRMPAFILTCNAWVLASNPLSLLPLFMGGSSTRALSRAVAWMAGLQFAAGLVLLTASILHLRPAYRAHAGGDGGPLSRWFSRPVWRFRPRPPVGDDPILWREMHTARGGLIGQLAGQSIMLAAYGALGYVTWFFAERAFLELWHHGYSAVSKSAGKPELNLVLRFFLDESGPGVPVDAARIDFNLFLRFVTGTVLYLLALIPSGVAVELLVSEREKETWSSLIATSLSARDILRGKLLSAIWRIRGLALTVVFLWTLGLLSGAVHPLGYLAANLILIASTAFCLMFGLVVALQVKDRKDAMGRNMALVLLPIVSAALPYLLPAGISSVLWGAASTPFVTWLCLASHREIHSAFVASNFDQAANWIGLNTGASPLLTALTCLLAILAPALCAWRMWKYAVANFDRFVGRPWKNPRAPRD